MATIPAFVEALFPTDIAYGSQGGPGYQTRIVTLTSGHEQRLVDWERARARYNVSFGVRTPAQLTALINFFYSVRGRATGFRFKDHADFQASTDPAAPPFPDLGLPIWPMNFATGNGVDTVFPLQKQYGLAPGVSYGRPITKPVGDTVRIFVTNPADGLPAEATGFWTLDSTTGLVTMSEVVPDGFGLAWLGEFHVPCRFNVDHLPTSFEQFAIGSASEIEIVEIKV